MTQVHHLKCWPQFYEMIRTKRKTFEVRKDDRGFMVDDVLHLQEYDNETETYTGRSMHVTVTYILRGPAFGVEARHVVMALGALGPAYPSAAHPSAAGNYFVDTRAKTAPQTIQDHFRTQEEWYDAHSRCPKCLHEIERTCIGVISLSGMSFRDDANKATCLRKGCGWRGMMRDAVPAPQTTLDPSCQTTTCPRCNGSGFINGVTPCSCHGTGLALKNPPLPPDKNVYTLTHTIDGRLLTDQQRADLDDHNRRTIEARGRATPGKFHRIYYHDADGTKLYFMGFLFGYLPKASKNPSDAIRIPDADLDEVLHKMVGTSKQPTLYETIP